MKGGQEGVKKDVVVFAFYCITLGDEWRKEGKERNSGKEGKELRN